MSMHSGSVARKIALALAVAAAGLTPAADAMGQNPDGEQTRNENPNRGLFFLNFGMLRPVGEFREHVDRGMRAEWGYVFFSGNYPAIGVRADGSFAIYGAESRRVPLSPEIPHADVRVRTENTIFSGGLGPQVYLGSGRARPYVFGTVGFSYFATRTGARADGHERDIASRTNFSDYSLALTGGGGLSVELLGGKTPVSLDLSASYQRNGVTEYLADGARNLERRPSGGWTASPILSDANLIAVKVGIIIGAH